MADGGLREKELFGCNREAPGAGKRGKRAELAAIYWHVDHCYALSL
jgi:hypothetical protein